MKKLFGLVTFLFVLYFSFQVLLVYVGNGHTINYQMEDGEYNFSVHEKFSANSKNDEDNYFLEIDVNDTSFNILTYENFKKSSKIIKNIRYYEDEQFKCIYVKYRYNKIVNDVICNNGNYAIAYHNIVNPSEGLKSFIQTIKEDGYSESEWLDDTNTKEESRSAILYSNNLINNHFIGLVQNDVLYRFNSIVKIAISALATVEGERLSAFTEKEYVVLNANSNNVLIYSFTSSDTQDISYNKTISNPTVIGGYGDSIFIYDQLNQIEYEADINAKTVLEVGNSTTSIKFYSEGAWQHKNLSEIDIYNLDFGSEYKNDYINPNYSKTVKIGNDHGYYYYFKLRGNEYDVYRSDIEHTDNIMYLFTTTNIDSVKFIEGYVYYIENESLKYYSDNKGNRTLLELEGMKENTLYKVFVDKTKKA